MQMPCSISDVYVPDLEDSNLDQVAPTVVEAALAEYLLEQEDEAGDLVKEIIASESGGSPLAQLLSHKVDSLMAYDKKELLLADAIRLIQSVQNAIEQKVINLDSEPDAYLTKLVDEARVYG